MVCRLLLVFIFCLGSLPALAQYLEHGDKELAQILKQGLTQECIGDIKGAEATWTRLAASAEDSLKTQPDHLIHLLVLARAQFGLRNFGAAKDSYERFCSNVPIFERDVVRDYPWVLTYQGVAFARLGNMEAMVQSLDSVPESLGEVQHIIQNELKHLPATPTQQDLNSLAGNVQAAMLKAQATILSNFRNETQIFAVAGVGMGTGEHNATVLNKPHEMELEFNPYIESLHFWKSF